MEGLLSLIYVPVFRQNRLDPCLACLRWSGVVLSLYDSYLSLIWPSSYPCLGINLSSFINLLINHRLIETLSLIILPFPYLTFPNRMFFLDVFIIFFFFFNHWDAYGTGLGTLEIYRLHTFKTIVPSHCESEHLVLAIETVSTEVSLFTLTALC